MPEISSMPCSLEQVSVSLNASWEFFQGVNLRLPSDEAEAERGGRQGSRQGVLKRRSVDAALMVPAGAGPHIRGDSEEER